MNNESAPIFWIYQIFQPKEQFYLLTYKKQIIKFRENWVLSVDGLFSSIARAELTIKKRIKSMDEQLLYYYNIKQHYYDPENFR